MFTIDNYSKWTCEIIMKFNSRASFGIVTLELIFGIITLKLKLIRATNMSYL